ncbi:MAG TPA: GGDEF domain-containing protein [Candidatus Nanopelagicaceae bacterium]|nr:GGDEF domain-containing protein [Candidatus Nanopelagicaceae bacterium]
MTSPTPSPLDKSTNLVRAPFSGKVSLDHGIASLILGLLGGALIPPLALLLGVSAAQALRPLFFGACLAAGLVVGAAGWLLGRQMIGRRVSRLAASTAWAAQVLAPAANSGEGAGSFPQECRLPVDSADQFGALARSLNDLIGDLVELHAVRDQLSTLAKVLLEQPGLEQLAESGLDQIRRSVGAPAGAIFLLQDGTLRKAASYGFIEPDRIAESELLATCLNSPEATVVPQPDEMNVDRILATSKPLEAVVLPLPGSSSPIGALLLALDQPTTALRRRSLSDQAATLGLALQGASARDALEQLAAQDGLTGQLNRTFGEARLHEEYARAVRSQVPLGVLMVDLDHFRAVNDIYGQPTGDKVLQAVANATAAVLREGDSMARFSADEFLILLPGADLGDSKDVAERIRMAVAGLEVPTDASCLRTTVSVGAASWPETGATGSAELIRRVDEALLSAKEGGRNRVTAAGLWPLTVSAKLPAAG